MALNIAELLIKFTARQTGANALAPQDFNPNIQKLLQWSPGTGANQADLIYAARRSIAASTNDDIDLAGVLTDAFGTVITNAELTMLMIISAVANLSNLTIGLGATPFLGFLGGTTPTIGPLRPGGVFLIGAPDASGIGTVGAGASDILRIANGAGGTASVDVIALGRTA